MQKDPSAVAKCGLFSVFESGRNSRRAFHLFEEIRFSRYANFSKPRVRCPTMHRQITLPNETFI